MYNKLLKVAVILPLLKKPSLDPKNLNYYCWVSKLPLRGKELEFVAASQLQGFLDEIYYLDSFQSNFQLSPVMGVSETNLGCLGG